MARIRISIAFLSIMVVGVSVLATVHFAPIGSISGAHPAPTRTGVAPAAVTTGRHTAAVPGGVQRAPRTPGYAPASPRAASPAPVAPRSFTGLHMTFPRTWHPVAYEVRGPQKPPVRLMCPCPENDASQISADQSAQSGQAPANGAPSDARVTLLEWNP